MPQTRAAVRANADAQLVDFNIKHSALGLSVDELKILIDRQDFHDTFEWLDRDNSGTISIEELYQLMRSMNLSVNKHDVRQVIQQMDHTDCDINSLNYVEFCLFMSGTEARGKEALLRAFVGDSKVLYDLVSTAMPLWKRMEQAGKLSGMRLTVAKYLDGTGSQLIVLVLIVFDVMAVMMEIMLSSTMCPQPTTHNATHDIVPNECTKPTTKLLGGGGGGTSSCTKQLLTRFAGSTVADAQLLGSGGGGVCGFGQQCNYYGCCQETAVQHQWHVILKTISVTILFIFLAQQLALIVCYRVEYCRRFFYMLDLTIIVVSLYFDLFLQVNGSGLLALLLSWRVLRIVHGLYTSFELHHGAAHKAANEAKEETIDQLAVVKEKNLSRKEKAHETLEHVIEDNVERGQGVQSSAKARPGVTVDAVAKSPLQEHPSTT